VKGEHRAHDLAYGVLEIAMRGGGQDGLHDGGDRGDEKEELGAAGTPARTPLDSEICLPQMSQL
jgi:hypothetical protein